MMAVCACLCRCTCVRELVHASRIPTTKRKKKQHICYFCSVNDIDVRHHHVVILVRIYHGLQLQALPWSLLIANCVVILI